MKAFVEPMHGIPGADPRMRRSPAGTGPRTAAAALGLTALLAVSAFTVGRGTALTLVPALLLASVLIHSQSKRPSSPFSAGRLLNETPSAIGMMAVGIRSGDSFDAVARNVADKGPGALASLFREVVLDVDCRNSPSISAGIAAMLSNVPKDANALRRAVHMLMAAADTADAAEREKMVSDAERTALDGLREMGETYGAGLNTPCMVVFGLGIMVPMVLVSILPMVHIGGAVNGGATLDLNLIMGITLVLVPAVIVATTLSVRARNPFRAPTSIGDWRVAGAFAVSVPVFTFAALGGAGIQTAIFVSALAGSTAALAATAPMVARERTRQRVENALGDLLFEVGNSLTAGGNFEGAVLEALAGRKECSALKVGLEREFVLSRGDIEGAVRNALSPYSAEMADAYARILRAAGRNPRDAGRLASSLARQRQDQESVRNRIGNKLKSMLDMMTGTAMFFAPMVLGLSVAMMKPLAKIADIGFAADVPIVLTAYLVQLAVLMTAMSASLSGRGGPCEWVMRLGLTVPVSLVVFSTCSAMSI